MIQTLLLDFLFHRIHLRQKSEDTLASSPLSPMSNHSPASIDLTLACSSNYPCLPHSLPPLKFRPYLFLTNNLPHLTSSLQVLFTLATCVVFPKYPVSYLKFCNEPSCIWDYDGTPYEVVSKLLMIQPPDSVCEALSPAPE